MYAAIKNFFAEGIRLQASANLFVLFDDGNAKTFSRKHYSAEQSAKAGAYYGNIEFIHLKNNDDLARRFNYFSTRKNQKGE